MKQTRWAWGKGHVQAPEAARSLVPSRAEENRFPPLPPRLFPQLPSCRSSNTSLAGLLSFLGSEISAAKLCDWRRSRQPVDLKEQLKSLGNCYAPSRSAARRVGKRGVSTGRSRWWQTQ